MVLISIEATCFLNTCTYVTVKLRNASLLRRLAKSSLIWTKALPQVRALSMNSLNWWWHRLYRDKGQGHSNLQMVCDTPSSQFQLTAKSTLKIFNVPWCKLAFSCYGYIDLELWPSDLNVNRFICDSWPTSIHKFSVREGKHYHVMGTLTLTFDLNLNRFICDSWPTSIPKFSVLEGKHYQVMDRKLFQLNFTLFDLDPWPQNW